MTVAIFLGSLLAVMALGVPIAYSLLLCGVALMWHLDLFDAQILAQNVINGADSFPLLAVPFFMLAGEIMNVGGLSRRIVDLALALVGHFRGGLGYVAIVAACLLAALSGAGTSATKRFLQHRTLVGTGHFSYSIYLVHAPILAVGWLYVVHPLHWSRNASFVMMIVTVVPVAIAASYGFYLLIERPFMNRRAAVAARSAS